MTSITTVVEKFANLLLDTCQRINPKPFYFYSLETANIYKTYEKIENSYIHKWLPYDDATTSAFGSLTSHPRSASKQ